MYYYHPAMALIALYILLPTGLFAIYCAYFKLRPIQKTEGRFSPIIFLIPVILYAVLRGYVGSRVTTLLGGDEYCRAYFSWLWTVDPFFALHDHIWLAGQFYILGIGYTILRDMPMVVELCGTVGMLSTICLSALITWQLWRSMVAATIAGMLVAGHHLIIWASFNAVAEVFSYPLMLASVALWVKGASHLGIDKTITPPSEPIKELKTSNLFFGLAAIPMALGTMFRFEMWFAGIALGLFYVVRSVRVVSASAEIPRTKVARSTFPLALGAILLAIFPLLWMASSWQTLGSPIAFFLKAEAANTQTDLGFYLRGSFIKMASAYPVALWSDHWPYLLLPVFALFLVLKPETRRRTLPYLLAATAILLVSMLTTAKSGLGSNYRPRYTTFLLLLFLPLSGGPIATVERALQNSIARYIVQVPLLGTAFILSYYSASYGRAHYSNGFGYDSEVISMGLRLGIAADDHRPETDTLYFWKPANKAAFYHTEADTDLYDHWVLAYHTRHPERVVQLIGADALDGYMQSTITNDILIVNRESPAALPANIELVEHFGKYSLYRVTAPR